MVQDPYKYPGSDCLVNKLGLSDSNVLTEAESKFVSIRLKFLNPDDFLNVSGFEKFKAVHQYLFQDVYGWAGQVRTVEIGKGAPFCFVANIEQQAKIVFSNLEKDSFSGSREDLVEKIAYHLGEVNVLHPFREGNGRAQRAYFDLLLRDSSFKLDWSKTTKQDNDLAFYANLVSASTKPIVDILDKCLVKNLYVERQVNRDISPNIGFS